MAESCSRPVCSWLPNGRTLRKDLAEEPCVRGLYDARAHRAACYRANLEKLNSFEPSTVTINTEVQAIQLDQDVIDQLEGTDDDTVIQRRNRMIDGVKLKLTKVNKDRAEGQ